MEFDVMGFVQRMLLGLGCWWLVAMGAGANDARSLFDQYRDRIYQIRLIELASGNKSSLGSGFQISADGILATNFHVVADAVHEPTRYRLEYVNSQDETGALKVLDLDVVNDLALVRLESSAGHFIPLAKVSPQQGEDVFSLGNPHDLGMTVVRGTHNGPIAHSFYQRVLFSGSINPGMSGGPALNTAGEVIGVNVATAGNELSFLVPVEKLRLLSSQYLQGEVTGVKDLQARIRQQLLANQQVQFVALLKSEWPSVRLGEAMVVGEIADYVRCWGVPDKSTRLRYKRVQSSCANDDYIFLSDNFSTGNLEYEFRWYDSKDLHPLQFYHAYKVGIQYATAPNQVSEKDVTRFDCHENFVGQSGKMKQQVVSKAVLCARQYKHYPGLYDVLYIAATVHAERKGLMSHFVLTGVDKSLGIAFARKFMEQVKWDLSSR